MTYLRRLLNLFLLVAIFSINAVFATTATFAGWTHLELGAGNYGADGHTKFSQEKTVLLKVKVISDAKNYIDELEEIGNGDYKPEEQYGVLFWTLDELVNRYGATGIFHVNDLYEDYATFAAEKLQDYALAKGYDSVIIEAIPGDYESLNAENNLMQYGKKSYDSVHLKNPEVSFFHDRIDGHNYIASDASRMQTRTLLHRLANLSENGLYLFILYKDGFVPSEERSEFIEKGVFYQTTNAWEPVPYIFPEGYVISKEHGKVFLIEPTPPTRE